MGDFSVASRVDNNHDSTNQQEKEDEHLQPINTETGIEQRLSSATLEHLCHSSNISLIPFWKKAIPAKQRIKEIEEGAKREFIDAIREPKEIEKLLFQLLKSAAEEILIINPAGGNFLLSKLDGIMQLL